MGTRFDPKYQMPTVMHGVGSVLVWGCFFGRGMVSLRRIYGYSEPECELTHSTDDHSTSSPEYRATDCFPSRQRLQSPCTSSQTWTRNHRITTMGWTSQSPDLNTFGGMRGELAKSLKNNHAPYSDEKFCQMEEVCQQMAMTKITALINCMRKR